MVRFYDMLMQDHKIPESYKREIEGSTVVVADNVASYYYEGTDKEHWDLYDFPNIAPPFERFWLECKAPDRIKSNERGILQWDRHMPSFWGFYCKAALLESIPERLSTVQGRKSLKEDLQKQFSSMHKSVLQLVPNYFDMVHNQGMEYVKDHTSEKEYTMICETMSIVEAVQHLENQDMEKAEKVLTKMYGYKWHMLIELTQRTSMYGGDTIYPCCYSWQIYVREDGSTMLHPVTNIPMILSTVGSSMSRYLQDMANGMHALGHSNEEIAQFVSDSFSPFLHTFLLSLSFLHCRNVALNTTTPPMHMVRSNKAKRRGEKPFQPVAFKTLDIKPMREILQHAGENEPEGQKTQKALHICRGHFKHYENGRGLFGKYKGTFWFPQQTRGGLEQGTVVKDYRIKID